jgi:hypothetical protein
MASVYRVGERIGEIERSLLTAAAKLDLQLVLILQSFYFPGDL